MSTIGNFLKKLIPGSRDGWDPVVIGWQKLATIEVKDKGVWIGDAQFAGSEEDGLVVRLAAGTYDVEIERVKYQKDERFSTLRLCADGVTNRGERLGETWADTGTQGIVDFESIQALAATDEGLEDRIMEAYETYESTCVADLGSGAVLVFSDAGFGDGDFAVYELLKDGKRVGVEVELIAKGTPYPF